jgi:AraC family cel operon transcriptional repressor
LIYTPVSDHFEYFEELDDVEQFYKTYYEVRDNPNKVAKLIKSVDNPKLFLVPEIYGHEVFNIRSLFDDVYEHEITIRKHARYSPPINHEHSYYEMIYVLKGNADNIIEEIPYKMSDGDIFLLPPGVCHRIWVGDDSVIVNIIIKKSLFTDRFLEEIGKDGVIAKFVRQNVYQPLGESKHLKFHTLHHAPLRNILALLVSEAFRGPNRFQIKKLLLATVFNYLKVSELYDGEDTCSESEITNNILEYIHKNHMTVTLSDVANHFNYSVSYLSKLIKKLTGMSFVNILQSIKLKEACHLLVTTNYKIETIMEMVGYNNTMYFNRVFKEKIGTSPSRYRKMHKESMITRSDN